MPYNLVIEEILGDDFKGVVMCDFYAAYNCIDKTQRCLVHLLRDIKNACRNIATTSSASPPTHPGLEFHNNRAERQLRPMVITRKISFGSNTDRGALRHCILNTVIETCKLQKQDPVHFLARAYKSDGLDAPDLTANSPPAAVCA